MPAAAVTPAPIAYIKVVAVKKLVVGSACHAVGSPPAGATGMSWHVLSVADGTGLGVSCGNVRATLRPVLLTPAQSYRGALHRVSR